MPMGVYHLATPWASNFRFTRAQIVERRGKYMVGFVYQRGCRDLCQDLRISRPHTTSAMSVGNLKMRRCRINISSTSGCICVDSSRYGGLQVLVLRLLMHYHVPYCVCDPRSLPQRNSGDHVLPSMMSLSGKSKIGQY